MFIEYYDESERSIEDGGNRWDIIRKIPEIFPIYLSEQPERSGQRIMNHRKIIFITRLHSNYKLTLDPHPVIA